MNIPQRCVRFAVVLTLLGCAPIAFGQADKQAGGASVPPDRVIAAYFHRTQRCPTCLRVSETVVKILKEHFAEPMQSSRLQYIEVDFQAPQNAHLTKSCQITGPQLVLIRVENGRVVAWQPMPKVWSLLIKPKELDRYITGGVETYLRQLEHPQSGAAQ